MNKVDELEPQPDSLVGSLYDKPDYRDRFAISVRPGRYDTVDQVVTAWFTEQPLWIRLLSTNAISGEKVVQAARTGGYVPGTKVGSWEVIERDENEIVFGDNMGFMEYGFALSLDEEEHRVEGSNAVRFLWPRTGKFYFALVRPMHRQFVKLLLAKTVRET